MPPLTFPFAVRLIGFRLLEEESFDAACADKATARHDYFRLADDNLQDPDLYVVNADDPKSLTALRGLHPGPMRPALLVGADRFDLPFPRVARPVTSPAVFEALDRLMEQRSEALARLQASDMVIVPERRRRVRLGDGRNAVDYERMRVKRAESGAVLVVDKTDVFRNHLAELLARYKVPVMWADSEVRAFEMCRQQAVAIVMINTSAQEVDPYRLCWAIKEKDAPVETTVMLLVGKAHDYDMQQAAYVRTDGYLIKPLMPQHLLGAIKKFLPLR
jgi:CheY-like chemotaxis protein